MIARSFSSRKSRQQGLTLIELIITVAIFGILASMAVSSFQKKKNRAKQAEAKLALTSYYVAQKSFYAEYSAYVPSLDAIGWYPDGDKRWYRVGNEDGVLYGGVITGYSGTFARPRSVEINVPASFNSCPLLGIPVPNADEPPYDVDNPQSFLAGAAGRLKENPAGSLGCDWWIIDEVKRLRNVQVGI